MIVNRTQSTGEPKYVFAVLEDDAAVRESLKFSLEIEGYEVHTYASPDEFLNDPRLAGFDCLIVDYHLPGTNGIDVLDKLRQQGNSTQAIVMTGNPDDNIRRRASAAAVTLIEKSSGAAALLEGIHKVIGNP
jgi:two-component system, LuxR family, response regulator FixJ